MYLVSAGYPDTYMIPGTTYYVPDTYVCMYQVSAGYPDAYMIPGTYYVPDTNVPGISRQTNVPPVDAHV